MNADVAKVLIRLGARYERAMQQRSYDSALRVERAIVAIADNEPDVWIEMWVVRGRNQVRHALRQEELHV